MLRTREGREGLVKWDSLANKANGRAMLAYGEVLTTNTSQGATVSEHIFALPAGSRGVTAYGAYTSGSRHREQSFVVTSDGAERGEVAGRRPLGDAREIRESDVVGNIVRNFARQPVKESALALLDRAENVRAGSVRRMQQGKQGLEQREADGKERSTLASAFARQRDADAARKAAERIEERVQEQRSLLRRMRDLGARVHEAVRAAVASRLERNQAERAEQEPTRRRGPRR